MFRLPFILCIVVFLAALAGSVCCGWQLTMQHVTPAEQVRLRNLIYFHFALTQAALVAAAVLFYLRHRRWKRYYLLVSYNEKGTALNPPGIHMPAERVYRCHLGNINSAPLPPQDAPVLVYPLFMQSGSSSGQKLMQRLAATYTKHRGARPHLFYQPVLGASPWLAEAAAEHIRPLLTADTGVLVVAHGSRLPEPPPEPALFCRRLRDLLEGTEVALGYFHQQPEARNMLAGMRAAHVLVLPFLLTEGIHTARDLPTAADAAACGKTLHRLPVAAALLPDDTHDSPTPRA